MSTIVETIQNISNDVQSTFEHLIKLVVRKTLRPPLNPLSKSDRVCFNPYTGKNEREYIGNWSEDIVNKYNYHLTNDCLGWVDDNITEFRLTAKFIKNTFPARKPATINRYSKLTNVAVPYSAYYLNGRDKNGNVPQTGVAPLNTFRSAIESILGRSMMNIMVNRKGEFAFTTNLSYSIHGVNSMQSVMILLIRLMHLFHPNSVLECQRQCYVSNYFLSNKIWLD